MLPRYKRGRKESFFEQIKYLWGNDDLRMMFEEFERGGTPEGIIVWDAEKLELALQSKCSFDTGSSKSVQLWIDRIRGMLETESARRLLGIIEQTEMNEWWQEIRGIREEIKKWKKIK